MNTLLLLQLHGTMQYHLWVFTSSPLQIETETILHNYVLSVTFISTVDLSRAERFTESRSNRPGWCLPSGDSV